MKKKAINNIIDQVRERAGIYEPGDLLILSDLLDSIHSLKEHMEESPQSINVLNKTEEVLNRVMEGETFEDLPGFLLSAADILADIIKYSASKISAKVIKSIESFLGEEIEDESDGFYEEETEDSEGALGDDFNLASETIKIFLAEAEERMTSAQDIILQLEGDMENKTLINDLFRVIHTIKGECGFLNLIKLGEVTHVLETLLDMLRYNEITNSQEIIDTILHSVDIVNDLLGALREEDKGRYNSQNIENVVQLIEERTREVRVPIGQVLQDRGLLNKDQVETIVEIQKESGFSKKFGEIALENNFIDKDIMDNTLSEQKNMKVKRDAIVKVNASQINYLVDMIGELLIAENQLQDENIAFLKKITKEIQHAAMMLRTVKVRNLFVNMKRVVRDASRKLDKQTVFDLEGEGLELDRNLVESMEEPLIHILRNAVGHGIESAEERRERGKDLAGHIVLKAERLGNQIIISVRDDGKGLDSEKILKEAISRKLITEEKAQLLKENEIFDFIFHPGFSTAGSIDKVSGRGVGMDIVKNTVTSLRGHLEIRSKRGEFTEFNLIFPLSMAIIDGMIILIDGVYFILPVVNIIETLRVDESRVHQIENKEAVINLRKEIIPVIRLRDFFRMHDSDVPSYELAIIVEHNKRKYAFIVDEIVNKKEVVIKSLGDRFKNLEGISAATVLSGGKIGFIVNIDQIVSVKKGRVHESETALKLG